MIDHMTLRSETLACEVESFHFKMSHLMFGEFVEKVMSNIDTHHKRHTCISVRHCDIADVIVSPGCS